MSERAGNETTLIVRRTIRAAPDRLFSYWTDPMHLMRWWGPAGVTCVAATIDLRVGGGYRIANRLADGSVLWISGEFEVVVPPRELVYTWRLEPEDAPSAEGLERVSVTFNPRGGSTEVIIVHEQILDPRARDGHERGWHECLDGLVRYVGLA